MDIAETLQPRECLSSSNLDRTHINGNSWKNSIQIITFDRVDIDKITPINVNFIYFSHFKESI